MSTFVLTIVLIVGFPLLLIFLSFIMIIVSIAKNKSNYNDSQETLELAQEIDLTLTKMTQRITALENILKS